MALALQVVGLPLGLYRRLRPEYEAWRKNIAGGLPFKVRLAPSNNQKHPIIDKAEIKQIEANVQDGFTRIAVIPFTRDWMEVARAFRFDCRVMRLPLAPEIQLWSMTWPQLQNSIRQATEFEELWLAQIQPSDLRHPLLLPPGSFQPETAVGDFWQQCDCYRDPDLLANAAKIVAELNRLHRIKGSDEGGAFWQDAKGRQFRMDPSFHGRSRSERAGHQSFRFCFAVPAGFHFDVVHEHGCGFSIDDSGGIRRHVERANVTPWGTVRPAARA